MEVYLLLILVIIVCKSLMVMETLLRNGDGQEPSDGQFDVPIGIAIDSKGLVYVADNNNARVQTFAPSIPK